MIGKLDRLARDVGFLVSLLNGDVPFLPLDLPRATRTTLLVLMTVAEAEALAASDRTKVALAAAKARGVRLGRPENLGALARQRCIAVRQAKARDCHRLPFLTASALLNVSFDRHRAAAVASRLI